MTQTQTESLTPDQLEVSWRPSPEHVERSNLKRFMDRHGLRTFDELWRWSVEDVSRFWDTVVQDLGLEWYTPYERVLDLSRGVQRPRWWVGGTFNYVHNAVDRHASGADADKLALACEAEEGSVRRLTYAELLAETNRCANALKALGVGKGDRVGLYLPMVAEVVIAQLALGKIGAIYTPIFSGFGAEAIAARLQDAEAKLLITCDGIPRRGNLVTTKEFADAAVALSPSVENVLVVRRAGRQDTPWTPGRDVWWDDVVPSQSAECATERTDPEDPYMIIYTSGTTGKPKGVLHVHGGFPIKGAQDMAHCFDITPSDTFFWLTDMGWMMGPWLVSGTLMLGATCFLYDGTPDFPDPDRIWDMVERHRITATGIAPTAIRALMRSGDEWVTRHDVSSLRILGSSGEPWNPGPWRWYQDVVGGGRCPIINYSGGTEISGGIVSCTVITPQKPTSFSGPIPGMDADVVDDQGQPVRGQVGELVLKQPWPGVTRGFWRDDERYLETYWSRLSDVWVHGDWALVDDDGYWYILGRSDDTIKVAGKRLGPAEVESAAVATP
ncbi:MAG TPA: AMP-binding protein, partial [Chloroflexota bacterium]|nr:AMP-binding protein [Chloroflexota bacterium]